MLLIHSRITPCDYVSSCILHQRDKPNDPVFCLCVFYFLVLSLRLSLVRFRCASRAGALRWRLRGLVASTAFWVCSDPLTQSYFCSITHIAAPCWPVGHTYSPEPSVGIYRGVTSDLHACRIFLHHSSRVDCTCQAPCPVWHLGYLTW